MNIAFIIDQTVTSTSSGNASADTGGSDSCSDRPGWNAPHLGDRVWSANSAAEPDSPPQSPSDNARNISSGSDFPYRQPQLLPAALLRIDVEGNDEVYAVPEPADPESTGARKRQASSTPFVEPTTRKQQSKWSSDEDAALVAFRGGGMRWEDVSKHLLNRSATSCRLRFQNYLERKAHWGDTEKNRLAWLYERYKEQMWEDIANAMRVPWRVAEAMHWELGREDLAARAGSNVFRLASPTAGVSWHHVSGNEVDEDAGVPFASAMGGVLPQGPHPHSQAPVHMHHHSLPQKKGHRRRGNLSGE